MTYVSRGDKPGTCMIYVGLQSYNAALGYYITLFPCIAIYLVGQKTGATLFYGLGYNFRNIEHIFTKFCTRASDSTCSTAARVTSFRHSFIHSNHGLFILNITP